jgi:pyruvate/2-oxoglutarate/acetoin dehydrogenase E1 component
VSVLTYREGLRQALAEEMRRDDRVFLLGEEIADPFGGSFKVTLGLSTEFGDQRVRNTPISEAAIVGAALGAALGGLRPVAEIMYVDFTTTCMDQIANQVAKLRYMTGGQATIPLVIRTQGGAGQGSAAQHAQSLEGWFVHTPGLKIVMPATPADAKGLLKSAIRDDDPVLFIEHKMLYGVRGDVPEGEHTTPLGVAEVKRPGNDITIVAYSRMVWRALEAAEIMATRGISAEVIDLRTLFPLDTDTVINSVQKTAHLVIASEAPSFAGFGGELAALVSYAAFDSLDAPIERVSSAHVPVPFAPILEDQVIPTSADIVQGANRALGIEQH